MRSRLEWVQITMVKVVGGGEGWHQRAGTCSGARRGGSEKVSFALDASNAFVTHETHETKQDITCINTGLHPVRFVRCCSRLQSLHQNPIPPCSERPLDRSSFPPVKCQLS